GGGFSHRMGLHDAALLKDNHLAHIPMGGLGERIAGAAALARGSGPLAFVEVEVDTLDQLREVLALRPGIVDFVLLDNMDAPALREAVRLRDAAGARVELEASGGVSLATVRAMAETGVERISVGRLTHSAPALDFGLDLM
ncbi:MAG: nicotinate-nucleotide diphosphorylase (carboxylating), partial [Phycisphaerales bacterium]|nr:nicotinate-nucleotide diphosphorylase (carboxylating) [Phycisphaerales bacterium]